MAGSIIPEIESRRALRAITSHSIESATIERLFTAAHLAPSCSNSQPWRFIQATAGRGLENVREALTRGNAWALPAPLIVAVCTHADLDCKLSDRREYALFGTGLATMNLVLQATREGLVAHPIAGYDPVKVRAALAIPEEFVIITLVIIAHPDPSAPQPSPRVRKPLAEVVFDGTFGAHASSP